MGLLDQVSGKGKIAPHCVSQKKKAKKRHI